MLLLLVEKGAIPYSREALQLLIDNGAGITIKNGDAKTALRLAVEWDDDESVKIILKARRNSGNVSTLEDLLEGDYEVYIRPDM